MKLRHAPTSPFVRKVMITAFETGLEDKIERVPTNVWDPNTDIGTDNPLGKVPTLFTDAGQVLYDSTVICEYLNEKGGGDLFASGDARWKALQMNSLGDGIAETGIRRLLEQRQGGDSPRKPWIDRQNMIINRVAETLETELDFLNGPFTIGQVAIACGLGWLEFRFDDLTWRDIAPGAAKWYDGICERPSLKATEYAEPA